MLLYRTASRLSQFDRRTRLNWLNPLKPNLLPQRRTTALLLLLSLSMPLPLALR
jgi:hypothetical protein